MAKKVGTLIKEARTEAGLTQEQLARKVKDCSAADIGKAERGEKDLTQDQLKQIAKATGVTQKSLLDAAKGSSSKTTGKKTTAKSGTSMKVTAAEKKLVELYREADSDTKKRAVSILKGEGVDAGDILGSLLGATGKTSGKKKDDDGILGTILDGAMDYLGKK